MLLLLQGSPAREWRAGEVSAALASHPHSAETRLLDLRARGLISAREADGELAYRYAPPRDAEPVVAALARAYAERRTSVITRIFSKPIDSVRTLADSFVVRNGKRHNPGERD